jgi:hypothetical protein
VNGEPVSPALTLTVTVIQVAAAVSYLAVLAADQKVVVVGISVLTMLLVIV